MNILKIPRRIGSLGLLALELNYNMQLHDCPMVEPDFKPQAIVVYTGSFWRTQLAFQQLEVLPPSTLLFISGVNKDQSLDQLCRASHYKINKIKHPYNIQLSDRATNTAGNANDLYYWLKNNSQITTFSLIVGSWQLPRAKVLTDRVVKKLCDEQGLPYNHYTIRYSVSDKESNLGCRNELWKLPLTQQGWDSRLNDNGLRPKGMIYKVVKQNPVSAYYF